MIGSILVASEEFNKRSPLVEELRSLGYRVIEAENGLRAAQLARKHRNIMLGFLDISFTDISLQMLIRELRLAARTSPLILLYNSRQQDNNVMRRIEEGVRAGANYFMPYNAEKLRIRLITSLLIAHSFLEQEVYYGWGDGPRLQDFDGFVAKSEAMKYCVAQASKLAETEQNIFIMGEHGTGRRDIAYAIHRNSAFVKGSFVTVYCAPYNMDVTVESDLCDLLTKKIEAAADGTLCLFNIDYLTSADQACLIEQLRKAKLAGAQFRTIAISATALSVLNNDEKKFDELTNFLEPATLHVPPLRQRREDIETIANQLLWRFSLELGFEQKIAGLTGAASDLLSQQSWAGNLSELEHSLYHALLLSEGPLLRLKDFPQLSGAVLPFVQSSPHLAGTQAGSEHKVYFKEDGNIKTMQTIEEEAIKTAIAHYKGQLSEVARRLKIGRSTLYRKIESWQNDKT